MHESEYHLEYTGVVSVNCVYNSSVPQLQGVSGLSALGEPHFFFEKSGNLINDTFAESQKLARP